MNREHERFDELAAAAALSGLDDAERAEFEAIQAAHGPDCQQCQAITAEYAEVAADLALSLPPQAVSTGAGDRLLAATRAPAPELTAPTPITRPTRRIRRMVLAAAAAVVLLVGGGAIGYAIHGSGGQSTQSAIADFLAQPGARLVAFPTSQGERLSVLYRPGHSAAWVVGAALPHPPGNRVYELWYQPAGSSRMHAAGTFRPTEAGSVRAPATVNSPITALAVSVEPPGGSTQPTSKPVYQVSLPG